MFNKNKKNNKGFTLVELLVVIAIIGILAVVAVPALFSNIEKSKVSKLEGNISAIKSAALSYYADNNEFFQQTTEATAETLSTTSGLADYLEDVKSVFKDEKYTITGAANTSSGSTLNIKFTESLGPKSVEKLAKDLGLSTTSDVTSTGVTVKIINKK